MATPVLPPDLQLDALRAQIPLGDAVLAGLADSLTSGVHLFHCPACGAVPGEVCRGIQLNESQTNAYFRRMPRTFKDYIPHTARRDVWFAWRTSPEISAWRRQAGGLNREGASRPSKYRHAHHASEIGNEWCAECGS